MIYIKIKKLLQPLNKNNDFLTKNDLYVEIEFNGTTKRTRTINNNNNPEWNEDFLFNYNKNIYDKLKKQIVKISVWDEDAFSRTKIFDDSITFFETAIDKFRTQHLEIDYGLLYYEKDKEIKYKDKTIENRDNSINHKNTIINQLNIKIKSMNKELIKYKNYYNENNDKISQEQEIIKIQSNMINDLKSKLKKIKEIVNKI